jgi:hypothetical protein
VAESRRVDEPAVHTLHLLVNPIDEHAFVVGLDADEVDPAILRPVAKETIDSVER